MMYVSKMLNHIHLGGSFVLRLISLLYGMSETTLSAKRKRRGAFSLLPPFACASRLV